MSGFGHDIAMQRLAPPPGAEDRRNAIRAGIAAARDDERLALRDIEQAKEALAAAAGERYAGGGSDDAVAAAEAELTAAEFRIRTVRLGLGFLLARAPSGVGLGH